MRVIGLFMAAVFLVMHCTEDPGQSKIEVEVYSESTASEWAYRLSDTAYEVRLEDCAIKWNVVETEGSESCLDFEIRSRCPRSFKAQEPIHEAILQRILIDHDTACFRSLSWGSFENHHDYSWQIPIALASLESELYADYKANYPDSKIKYLNDLFVQLANQTKAYQGLSDLFEKHGLKIQLSGVEKVFAQKVDDLPFAEELRAVGVKGNPRVIYDVGMSYFSIQHVPIIH